MAQVTTESKPFGPSGIPLSTKREGLFKDAIRRLVKNRAAVLGATIIVLLISDGDFCTFDCDQEI